MKVTIRTHDGNMSNTVRDRIERRVRFGLTRYEPEVRRVEVCLGGKGLAGDERNLPLRVRVQFRTLPEVVVDDVMTNLRSAVDRAIGRASRAIKHRFLVDKPVAWHQPREAFSTSLAGECRLVD